RAEQISRGIHHQGTERISTCEIVVGTLHNRVVNPPAVVVGHKLKDSSRVVGCATLGHAVEVAGCVGYETAVWKGPAGVIAVEGVRNVAANRCMQIHSRNQGESQ